MTLAPQHAATRTPGGPDARGRKDGTGAGTAPGPARRARRWGAYGLLMLGLVAALAVLGVLNIAQGTSGMTPGEVVGALLGRADEQTRALVLTTRVPRLLAGAALGAALGLSGGALQTLTRNPLASPDTLAVNAGAFFALTVAAVLGIGIGGITGSLLAFAGGLAAAGATMLLTRGGSDPVRLVLGGSVLAMAIGSLTSMLILLNTESTEGLYSWGSGSLAQISSAPLLQASPLLAVGTVGLFALSRRLDVLSLGEDTARSLGVPVARVRVLTVCCAVALAAGAVSVVGPLGFVGLAAPAVVRLLGVKVLALRRSAALMAAAALAGAVVSLGADVALRSVLGALGALDVPTGVATSLLGAAVMIVIAFLLGDRRGAGHGRASTLSAAAGLRARLAWWRHSYTLVAALVLLLGALVAGLLLGDATVLLGDVANWLRGAASVRLEIVLSTRWPRVAVAAVAGASLALSGALVQAVTRNPLADPGLLGVSAGAGTGAIISLLVLPGVGFSGIVAGALIGGGIAAALTLGLGLTGGRDDTTRLVLVGLGVGTAALAITTMIVAGTDPYNQAKALTWLAGSTYGATPVHALVGAAVLVVAFAIAQHLSRSLDLAQLDETTPVVLGVRMGGLRWTVLVVSVVLAASATAIVGVIAFVGLVAPHAARMLTGPRHRFLMLLTVLLGAALVVVADVLGRSLIAPGQLPAGTTTAVLGAPYFLYLLARTGRPRRG